MPEQQQSGQDNSLDMLIIIAIIMGAIILTWYFGRVYIASAVLHVRYYEIIAIDFVLSLVVKILIFTGLPAPQLEFANWLVYIKKSIGTDVGFDSLINISTMVGNYLRYPLTALVFGGAAWLHFGGAAHRFRNIYDSKLLKTKEQEIWPQISPVVGLDLVNTKLDDGPWAFALSPMRFCKKLDLLDIEEKYGKYKATLRRGAAHRILSLQVGPKWRGVETLPIYLKALFAIFAARVNADKKGSEALLDQIAASARYGKLNFDGTEALLRKHVGTKKVGKILSIHGYVTTAMASMLVGARELGVLATAEFIWLKPLDRRMWYMLNSVGRSTAVPEICGAFAHWLAEKKLGLPLTVPMIDEGVKGLELALADMIYKPDEKE